MAQQFALDHDTPAHNPRYTDAFVVLAATVLSLAIGVWCLLRLGLALWSGAVAALAVYAVLLSLHLAVRRSLVAAGGAPAESERDDVWMRGPHARAEPQHPEGSRAAPADASLSPEEEVARWAAAARKIEGGQKQKPLELPQARATDPFNFRPKPEPSLPQPPAATAPATIATRAPDAAKPQPAGAAQPEMSVELIQDLIKKLADEINTTTAGERADKPAPANATEALIGHSVAALQATQRTMAGPHADVRTTPDPAPAPGGGISSWWPTAEPATSVEPGAPRPAGAPPALNPQLARIAEAVAAERMEVLLEPIHALAEGRARHFEVSMRLLTADGAALEQGEFTRAARGSGLMPHIDAARMVRAARVARRLSQRGRQGSVLAAVAGESLTDDDFLFSAVEEQGGATGTMSLVLAFTQGEVRAFTPGHVQALGALAAAGFRFALEEVTDLDMDFAGLEKMGFAFVELDAPVFLDGLPAASARVPASDICRHLADFGLTLIVGHIEDDWLLARILGFGVLFGKGTLFGAPRLVKDEVVAA